MGARIGLVDMARSVVASGAPHRASGELALHVLEIMLAIADAVEHGGTMAIESTVPPIEPLSKNWSATASQI